MMEAKIIHYFASVYTGSNGGYVYYFANPEAFKSLKETGIISKELEGNINHPLSCFQLPGELVGGTDVSIINSHVYGAIRIIYKKAPKLYSFAESILYQVNRVRKGWAK